MDELGKRKTSSPSRCGNGNQHTISFAGVLLLRFPGRAKQQMKGMEGFTWQQPYHCWLLPLLSRDDPEGDWAGVYVVCAGG
jgi:hypothetical protein